LKGLKDAIAYRFSGAKKEVVVVEEDVEVDWEKETSEWWIKTEKIMGEMTNKWIQRHEKGAKYWSG